MINKKSKRKIRKKKIKNLKKEVIDLKKVFVIKIFLKE